MYLLFIVGVIGVLVMTFHLLYVIYRGIDEEDNEKLNYYRKQIVVKDFDVTFNKGNSEGMKENGSM